MIGGGGQVRKNHANQPSPLIARARRGVRPLKAGAGQALVLNFPYRVVRRAHGAAGPEKPRRDTPPGLGPRRWSAEPPQVAKAGFRERKGLSNAQTHNKSEARTRNSERKSC